jgi:ATP-dependent protease HslVU (ClpYQ) peptidase subunit
MGPVLPENPLTLPALAPPPRRGSTYIGVAMTTIAVNKDMMAADSKCTLGSVAFSTPKLFRKNGAIIGCAGSTAPANRFVKWYGTDDPVPDFGKKFDGDDEDIDFEAVVLTDEGRIFYYEYQRGFEPNEIIDEKGFAIGSGGESALTALRVYSATPTEAVEAACQVNEDTAGPVVTFMREPKVRKRRKDRV